MKPISLALVGVGGYGRAHLQTIASLGAEVRLVAVVDPGFSEPPEFLSEWPGTRWYPTWEALMASDAERPDAVAVAAPIPHHAAYAQAALEAGLPLYLEKPPVPLLTQLDALLATEAKAPPGAWVQVGFQFTFTEQMRALGEAIRSGALGEIRHYRLLACSRREASYYQRSGWAGKLHWRGEPVLDGPATNAVAHGVSDLFTLEAFRCGGPVLPEEITGEVYRAAPIESYDVASLTGRFPGGATFSFATAHAVDADLAPRLEVVGSLGKAEVHGPHRTLYLSVPPGEVAAPEPNMLASYRHFLRAIRTGTRPALGLAEVRPYVAVTNALFVSSGGIHTIPEEYHSQRNHVQHIEGFEQVATEAFRNGVNFSQAGAPWGRSGEPFAFKPGFEATLAAYFAERVF